MKKLIVFFLLSTSLLHASEYTLDFFIETALENSVEILSYETSLLNSKTSLTSAYLGMLPEASINFQKSFSWAEPLQGKEFSTFSHNLGLSISKAVYFNDPTYFNIKTNQKKQEIAELEFLDNQKKLVFSVLEKYLELIVLEKKLSIIQKNYALKVKNHAKTISLYELGNASQIDLQSSEITLLNYEISLIESQINLKSKRKAFFTFLQIADSGYELSEPNLLINEVNFDYSENYSLKNMDKELDVMSINLMQSFLEFFPAISLSATYNNIFESWQKNDVLENTNYNSDNLSLGLNISYPLFNFPEHKQDYSILRRNQRIAIAHYEYKKKENTELFLSLKDDYNNSLKIYELLYKKLQLSQKNYELAEKKYSMNLLSLLEFEDAQNIYLDSQINYVTHYYQTIIKLENLKLLISDKILNEW